MNASCNTVKRVKTAKLVTSSSFVFSFRSQITVAPVTDELCKYFLIWKRIYNFLHAYVVLILL